MKAGDKVIRGEASYEAACVEHFIEDLESSLGVAASAGPPSLTGAILAVEDMCFQNWLREASADPYPRDAVWEAETQERKVHAALVRDILGNLFRPVALDSSWLTSTVTNLGEAIYDERAFERMPILGDALEEAGCSNADILNHCRQSGEHCRGCWVVDLLLGKE